MFEERGGNGKNAALTHGSLPSCRNGLAAISRSGFPTPVPIREEADL